VASCAEVARRSWEAGGLAECTAPAHNWARLWENRPLRDIRETDIRNIVASGLEEHLQLEYKRELYADGATGRREFLQDICMFANTAGGILLIGVPELRDAQGQPTGVPDPAGDLGLETPNPEAVLAAYDARVMEAIEERLPLESTAIQVGNGRYVLALRVRNSANKPHSVRHDGHIYFPARRERQRYAMNVREIKDLVMRTASRLHEAKELLKNSFYEVPRTANLPYLIVGIIPIFFDDFLVDVRRPEVLQSVGSFSRGGVRVYRNPVYSFDGIEHRDNNLDYSVKFRRNGLLSSSSILPLFPRRQGEENRHIFVPTSIDVQLRHFVMQARGVYDAANISAPFILGMMLRIQLLLVGAYGGPVGFGEEYTEAVPARDYAFPDTQVDDLSETDSLIRPLCDQAHQMFGREGSPSFDEEGVWTARY
jgi:hypothetical protein